MENIDRPQAGETADQAASHEARAPASIPRPRGDGRSGAVCRCGPPQSSPALPKRSIMRAEVLECRFAEIGARVKVLRALRSGTLINVWQDRRGEYFELAVARGKVSLNVVEADADER